MFEKIYAHCNSTLFLLIIYWGFYWGSLYRRQCRGQRVGPSGESLGQVTAAGGRSPTSHPTPTARRDIKSLKQEMHSKTNTRALSWVEVGSAWTTRGEVGRTHTFGPGSMSFCLIFTVVSMNPEQLPMSSGWEGRLVGGVWLSSCSPSSPSSSSSSSPSLDTTDPGDSSLLTDWTKG